MRNRANNLYEIYVVTPRQSLTDANPLSSIGEQGSMSPDIHGLDIRGDGELCFVCLPPCIRIPYLEATPRTNIIPTAAADVPFVVNQKALALQRGTAS